MSNPCVKQIRWVCGSTNGAKSVSRVYHEVVVDVEIDAA